MDEELHNDLVAIQRALINCRNGLTMAGINFNSAVATEINRALGLVEKHVARHIEFVPGRTPDVSAGPFTLQLYEADKETSTMVDLTKSSVSRHPVPNPKVTDEFGQRTRNGSPIYPKPGATVGRASTERGRGEGATCSYDMKSDEIYRSRVVTRASIRADRVKHLDE
jgi:hypothetical protein